MQQLPRRFTDEEMAVIIKRAAALQAAREARSVTLEELQEIGVQVGIDPALIAHVAQGGSLRLARSKGRLPKARWAAARPIPARRNPPLRPPVSKSAAHRSISTLTRLPPRSSSITLFVPSRKTTLTRRCESRTARPSILSITSPSRIPRH